MAVPLRYGIRLLGVLLAVCIYPVSVSAAEAEQPAYPRHVDLVTLGTVLGMRGQTASERGLPVRFASADVASVLIDPEFRYEGFYLHRILISKVATIAGQTDSWRVQGLLVFEDVAGRRAYAQYSTYYRLLSEGIEITRAAAKAFTPPEPTIVWFAVRQKDVMAGMLEPENHAELIKLAATRSLTNVPSVTEDYAVFALSMDRFASSEQMTFQSSVQGLEIGRANLGGWPVGVYTGRFDPNEIGGKLKVNLVGEVFPTETLVLPSFPTRPFEWDSDAQ